MEYEGSLWVATSLGGALRLDMPGQGVTMMTGQQYMGRQGLSNDAFGFYPDSRGNLYCITDMGIKKYDHASDRFIPFSPGRTSNTSLQQPSLKTRTVTCGSAPSTAGSTGRTGRAVR
ncbi:MAG: hypothetical protein U5L72_15205 [Bacteroidales bacterium]|nr:hypothetical protein [Bacteroidales bacterium]